MDFSVSAQKPSNLDRTLSADPPLTAERRNYTYVLNERTGKKWLPDSTAGRAFLVIFLILFSWFFLLLYLIFAVQLVFDQSRRREVWADLFLLKPGELILTQSSIRVGRPTKVTFQRQAKKRKVLSQNGSITFKLYCFERVQYTVGTDTRTVVARVEERILATQTVNATASDRISCQFDFEISKQSPTSFEADHNKIRWVIVAEQHIPTVKTCLRSKFPVLVEG